jgi:hypothetical protein
MKHVQVEWCGLCNKSDPFFTRYRVDSLTQFLNTSKREMGDHWILVQQLESPWLSLYFTREPTGCIGTMVNSMYRLMLESRQVTRWPKALTIILLANPETQVTRGNQCMYWMITKCSILVYCCNGCNNILTVCW